MRYNVEGRNVDVYWNDVILWDSNTIKFKDIKSFITRVVWLEPHCNVFKQGIPFLCAELLVHNILYKLGICKTKTEHTNLSLVGDMAWYERSLYLILSIFFY